MNLKVATTQFSLKELNQSGDFWMRVEDLTQKASLQNADLILFPEYFNLSWALHLCQKGIFIERLKMINPYLDEFKENFRQLSNKYNMCIVAGTTPVYENSKLYNRCYVFKNQNPSLDTDIFYQDKLNRTRFENEIWNIAQSETAIQYFKLKGIKIGIAICYDIEFPKYCSELARQQVELILVPSCTENIHGYWRVRHCSEARSIENQAYVVMSSIVSGNEKYPEIFTHYGQGGIYTPCDVGFPEGGILKLGACNEEGVVVANLDFAQIEEIRKNGTVLNLRDQLL